MFRIAWNRVLNSDLIFYTFKTFSDTTFSLRNLVNCLCLPSFKGFIYQDTSIIWKQNFECHYTIPYTHNQFNFQIGFVFSWFHWSSYQDTTKCLAFLFMKFCHWHLLSFSSLCAFCLHCHASLSASKGRNDVNYCYATSDDMFQASNSYEWFLLHIIDNTIRFYDFVDTLKTTNRATMSFPLKPRQTQGLPG